MLKKKNLYVIIATVTIAILASISAFLGFLIHLHWQKLDSVLKYYETVSRLDTISYAKNIDVSSLKIGLGLKNLPIVEGSIKNRGKKSVLAVALNINFLDSQNNTVFTYVAYPMEPLHSPAFFKKIHFTHFVLLKEPVLEPDSTTLFRCILWRCKKRFIKMLKKNSFSNNPGEWCGKVTAEVKQLYLKPI